jgi:ParB family chromosome partitioning protein
MKANVGCFVIIGADGQPRSRAASTATSRSNGARRRVRRGRGCGAGDGGSADNKPKPLSQKLVEELAVQRRDILAINLASNPAIALDYMIFAIADSRAHTYGAQAHGTTIRAPSPSLYLANYPESPAHTLMADMRETLDTVWTEHDRTVDRFYRLQRARRRCQGELALLLRRAQSRSQHGRRASPASPARNRSISTIIWRA